jgi:hypothetical protein
VNVLAEKTLVRERRKYSPADQAKALALVLREEFGVAFRFHDAADGGPLPSGDEDPPAPSLAPELVVEVAAGGRAEVTALPPGAFRIALPLSQAGRPVLVAVAVLPALTPASEPERVRLQKWAQAVAERLRLTDQLFTPGGVAAAAPPLAPPAAQAAIAWEALLTLDHLLRRTRIHKDGARTAHRILEGAIALLQVRTLVWVPSQPDAAPVVLGEACLTPGEARDLAAALAKMAGDSPEPVLCNDVREALGVRCPRVFNLLALPVVDQEPPGWVVALNKRGTPGAERARPGSTRDEDDSLCAPRVALPLPFRRSDAALLTPFVALLELHARAARRYQDLKELLVGLTRSLTAALDAKDSYTFGHSERVARVAMELGRELGLQADDLSDIYLAGLLHDVGKIGIRDSVLTKPGPLTREEYEHIKQHVTIGYNILSELHPIRNLLPGVLWHHERWDGQGYPHGLAGEAIPLLARILAVADAFDAMSTARPYREAMPPRRVEEVLTSGAGTQWDASVIDAFNNCRQKVHAIRQRGVGDSLCVALDGALRSAELAPPPTDSVVRDPVRD